MMVGVFDCGPTGRRFEFASHRKTGRLDFSPVVHDWVNKGLGMSSRVCATGNIKDPVSLIEKSRASCFGGRFHSSSNHHHQAE